MKHLFALFALSLSCSAFAGNCPTYTMTCELQKINNAGFFSTVATKTAEFIEVNVDEPSMPPNSCSMNVSFSQAETGMETSLNASLTPEMEAFLYAGKKNGGAIGPQFSLEAQGSKSFSIHHKDSKLVCTVNLSGSKAHIY